MSGGLLAAARGIFFGSTKRTVATVGGGLLGLNMLSRARTNPAYGQLSAFQGMNPAMMGGGMNPQMMAMMQQRGGMV